MTSNKAQAVHVFAASHERHEYNGVPEEHGLVTSQDLLQPSARLSSASTPGGSFLQSAFSNPDSPTSVSRASVDLGLREPPDPRRGSPVPSSVNNAPDGRGPVASALPLVHHSLGLQPPSSPPDIPPPSSPTLDDPESITQKFLRDLENPVLLSDPHVLQQLVQAATAAVATQTSQMVCPQFVNWNMGQQTGVNLSPILRPTAVYTLPTVHEQAEFLRRRTSLTNDSVNSKQPVPAYSLESQPTPDMLRASVPLLPCYGGSKSESPILSSLGWLMQSPSLVPAATGSPADEALTSEARSSFPVQPQFPECLSSPIVAPFSDATYSQAQQQPPPQLLHTGIVDNRSYWTADNDIPRDIRSSIVVHGVPRRWTAENLRNVFMPFGKVLQYRLDLDGATGRHRGRGFIEFECPESAAAAIAYVNEKVVEDGKRLKVQLKLPGWQRRQHQDSSVTQTSPSELRDNATHLPFMSSMPSASKPVLSSRGTSSFDMISSAIAVTLTGARDGGTSSGEGAAWQKQYQLAAAMPNTATAAPTATNVNYTEMHEKKSVVDRYGEVPSVRTSPSGSAIAQDSDAASPSQPVVTAMPSTARHRHGHKTNGYSAPGARATAQSKSSGVSIIPENNLFVFHVPPDWDEAEFRRRFEVFGTIRCLGFPKDVMTPWGHRGYGFVCYESHEAACRAIQQMDGKEIQAGRRLKVEIKKPSGWQSRVTSRSAPDKGGGSSLYYGGDTGRSIYGVSDSKSSPTGGASAVMMLPQNHLPGSAWRSNDVLLHPRPYMTPSNDFTLPYNYDSRDVRPPSVMPTSPTYADVNGNNSSPHYSLGRNSS